MKFVQVRLPYTSRSDVFHFYPIGDTHYGHVNTDIDLIEKTFSIIEKDRMARVIGMGDYGNCDIPGDKFFDFDSLDLAHFPTPDTQYEKVTNQFRRVKEKTDVLLSGNHDDRMAVKHSHNFVKSMGEELGVPWAWTGAYIRYLFSRGNGKADCWAFDVYATHGFAVEMRSEGGKLNRLVQMRDTFPAANLYLMGHVHTIGMTRKTPLYMDKTGHIREIPQRFVLTGAFLRGYVDGNPSYVERKMLPPSALGSPLIAVKPNTHEITVHEVHPDTIREEN